MDKKLKNLINTPYKYGFSTKVNKETINKGLNENIIRLISKKKKRTGIYVEIPFKSF